MAILSSLAVGQKIKVPVEPVAQPYFGTQLIFTVAAKNHTGYPANSVTLLVDRIERIICMDAAEPNSLGGMSSEGNADYFYSNRLRWLNSSNTSNWYNPTHSNDAPPDTGNHAYAGQPGFLAALGPTYASAILTTTVPYLYYSSGGGPYLSSFTAKVYDLSRVEISGYGDIREGQKLAIFNTSGNAVRYPSAHCVAMYGAYVAGLSVNGPRSWASRSPSSRTRFNYVDTSGMVVNGESVAHPANFPNGVICVHNMPGDQMISDTPDADGYYSVLFNYAPSAPVGVNASSTTYAGQNLTISWNASIDPEGDSIIYYVERSIDGAAYTPVGQTTGLSYTDSVQEGWETLRYRVKATDAYENASGYTLSNEVTVLINEPPVISGTDAGLGIKTEGFSYPYSVTDTEGDAVTIEEAIDEVPFRTYDAALGTEYTFDVIGDTFTALSYGPHVLRITATDAVNNVSSRILAITKESNYLEITLKQPIATSARPVRLSIDVKRDIPAGASFQVWAANNPYDPTPVWEDCTRAVHQGTAHVFANTLNAALQHGLNVRVKAQRHDAVGVCWVSGIIGNIETE